MSSEDMVLSVKNVSKCFEMYEKPVYRLYQTLCAGKKKFYKEFWALRDINFEIRRGECVGIIGKNGAGKSTLLQIITGTLAATTGTVELKGRVAALLELGSGFNPEFTGRENVYLNGAILGLSKEEIDQRYDEILAFADIGEFIDQPVKTYSSGMMVRLAFAVQVMVDPDVLIVDEALAVGDAAFQRKCYARMDALQESGTTILFVTHDTETVKQRCTRVVLLSGGHVAFDGDALAGVFMYLRMLFPEEAVQFGGGDTPPVVSKGLKVSDADAYVYRNTIAAGGDLRYGIAGGRVVQVDIRGIVSPNVMITPGRVIIDVTCEWDVDFLRGKAASDEYLPNINIGCGLMSVKNVLVLGTNTYLQGLRIDPFSRNKAIVRFVFPMPELPTGEYFIHASIQMGTQAHALHLDWGERLVGLVVSAGRLVPGEVGVEYEVSVLD